MSVHRLIIGQSMSGKTNLAKRIAGDFAAHGGDVVVFDPLASSGWPGSAEKYADPELFLSEIGGKRSSAVFIDEARVLWEHDQRAADRILYQYRHHGLQVHLIAQRAKMVPPNARDQCSTVYAFRQSSSDAKILAEEYHPDMVGVSSLGKGEFLLSDGFGCWRWRLDYTAGLPPKPKPEK